MNISEVAEKPHTPIIETKHKPQVVNEYFLGGVSVGSKDNCKGLKYSLWDGIFSNAMLALTETFSVAAAVYLNASPLAISILGSLPLLMSSLGQFILPRLINPSKGRKHYVLKGTFSQSVSLFILAFTGWLSASISPWFFVIIFCIYGFCGNVVSGLWIAWMGDLVPTDVRGRHFAWRNRLFSLTQLFCAIGAGFFSRKYSNDNTHWLFFACIFFTASFFRLVSSCMLSFQHEPKVLISNNKKSVLSLTKTNKPFLFYITSAALMLGAVAISGPFFNVWYVRDLKFDFLTLSIASAATIIGTIVSLPVWGKLADSIGNRRVILWTGFMVATVPIPYIFSSHSWQIWLLNFYTGLCWSGYNLSNFNYLLCAAGHENKEKLLSLSVAASGIASFAFSLLGGYISTRLPELFGWQLKTLFLISSILRFTVFGIFFFRFPVCEKEAQPSILVFHQIPGYRAGMGILRNAFRAFRRT